MLVLSLIMQMAQDAKAIRENPATRHRLPRAVAQDPVFLNVEEVNALAAAVPEPFGVLVQFAAYTGLRPEELCGLRVGRVNLLARSVEVAETLTVVGGHLISGPTKTYAKRTVSMSPAIAGLLAGLLAERATKLGRALEPGDSVFTAQKGGLLRRDHLHQRIIRPAAIRAGLPASLRVHDLRHTCASLLIASGAHPKAIQERLGHSSITVTLDIYGHMFPALQEALTDRLEELYRANEGRRWEPEPRSVVPLHG
jgi:integrase